jgi:hypothetical protein
VVTGSNLLTNSIFRTEFHLRADNEHEESSNGLICHINISQSGIQILKLNKELKAVEFRSFLIPNSTSDSVWSEHLRTTLNSPEFVTECVDPNCSYSVSTSKVVLIPASLHATEKSALNYQFMFGDSEGVKLSEQQLINTDIIGIQGIPNGVDELIGNSVSSSFLNLVNQLHPESSRTRAHLTLEGKEFALVIFKGSELEFSNWFRFDTAEDVLYYLMATLETLKILHSEIEIELSGHVDKGDEIHSAISKYLSKISFRKRPKNLNYSYSFKDMPEHRYPFIFAAACE